MNLQCSTTPNRLLKLAVLSAGLVAGWLSGAFLLPGRQLPDSQRPASANFRTIPVLQETLQPQAASIRWTKGEIADWVDEVISRKASISEAIWAAAPEDQIVLRREVWRLLRDRGMWLEALDAVWNAPDDDQPGSAAELTDYLRQANPSGISTDLLARVEAGKLPWNALALMLSRWRSQDAKGAAAFVRNLAGTEPWKAELRREMIFALVSTHPGEVTSQDLESAYADKMQPAKVITSLGQALGFGDPQRGLAWALSLDGPIQKRAALSAVLSGASGHEQQFWTVLPMVDDPALKLNAVKMWGANRAHDKSGPKLEVVLAVADNDLRNWALSGYFSTLAVKEPATAAAQAVELYSAGRAGISAVETVFRASPEQAQEILRSANVPSDVRAAAQLVVEQKRQK